MRPSGFAGATHVVFDGRTFNGSSTGTGGRCSAGKVSLQAPRRVATMSAAEGTNDLT